MWVCQWGLSLQSIWGFPNLGIPQQLDRKKRENPTKMDEKNGYPYFRKPPCFSGENGE